MARKIECERCKKQELVALSGSWVTVELSLNSDNNSNNEFDTSYEICPSCVGDLGRFLKSVEPSKMVTSEYCDEERHIFGNEEDMCRCGRWTFSKIRVIIPPITPDPDIPF